MNAEPVLLIQSIDTNSRILRATLVVGLLFWLSACGFQLSGNQSTTLEQVAVYSNAGIATSSNQVVRFPIADQLLNDLERQGVNTQASSDKTPSITIVSESLTEDALTLSAGLFERQIRLSKEIRYQVKTGTQAVPTVETISLSRDLINDPNNPAAKDQERDLIQQEINRELSKRLIQRLNQLAVPGN